MTNYLLICIAFQIGYYTGNNDYETFSESQKIDFIKTLVADESKIGSAAGLKLEELSNREVSLLSIGALLLFICWSAGLYFTEGIFVTTQEYKYPPRLYYLSYALFSLNCCFLFCKTKNIISNITF